MARPRTDRYNVLLEVCAATNDYDRGCQLIDRMLEEGVQPDAFTVAAVANRKSLRSYLKRGL
jgi:pentatricopeptide repeat protein